MKTFIKTSLGVAALMLAVPAQAEDFTPAFAPYAGFDVVHYNVSYKDDGDAFLDDSLNGLNIHIGNRFSQNFGAELGYFRTRNESLNGDVGGVPFNSKVQLQGLTLDALGYLPVTTDKAVELIGTAGLSWTKADIKLSAPGVAEDGDDSEIGFRIGGGAQYNINDQINLRGLIRYNTADFDDSVDRNWVYSAGLNFNF